MADISKELSKTIPEKFNPEDYNFAAGCANLIDVRMVNGSHQLDIEIAHEDEVELSLTRGLSDLQFEEETMIAGAIFHFVVSGKFKDREQFRLMADFALGYRFSEKVEGNAALAYVSRVGMFATYPYFRSHLASMAWAMGLTLPPLPPISAANRLPAKKSNSGKKSASTAAKADHKVARKRAK